MAVNWERYREIDLQADDLHRLRPAKVTVEFDEFVELKRAVLLLRRIIGVDDGSDLRIVEEQMAAIATKIYRQFASDPDVIALREEQMELLEEER